MDVMSAATEPPWNRTLLTHQSIPNSNSTETFDEYCEPITALASFGKAYGSVHGYIALILCLMSIVSNSFNVIVLNQPSMVSPSNFLLTILAASDALLMTSYVPFAAYFLIGKRLSNSSYGWSVFLLLHISLQNLLHSISSNIIVTLAFFRVIYVRCLIRCHQLCSMRRARIAVCLVSIIGVLLTIPCFLSHHIEPVPLSTASNTASIEGYIVTYVNNPVLIGYLYWNTAVFIKLLPLVCLTVLSLIIVTTVKQRSAKMRRLKCGNRKSLVLAKPDNGLLHHVHDNKARQIDVSMAPLRELSKKTNEVEATSCATESLSKRDKAETRMTHLLLAVVLIFMFTLLPQAILLFLNGFLGSCFTITVYNQLGDFTDLLTIMNNGVNFVLYCSMSRQFRATFLRLFCPRFGARESRRFWCFHTVQLPSSPTQ